MNPGILPARAPAKRTERETLAVHATSRKLLRVRAMSFLSFIYGFEHTFVFDLTTGVFIAFVFPSQLPQNRTIPAHSLARRSVTFWRAAPFTIMNERN